MSRYLRQSTASQTRTIGPFVDDADFKTLENGLTIANTDVVIKKAGAASGTKNSGGATADGSGGLCHLTWDATDTATVGELYYSVKVAGALVVFGAYTVLEEAVYDALFASSAPGYVANAPVNVAQISGSSTAADNAEIVFATDFATNYSTTTDKWQVEANVLQIEGSDATNQIRDAVVDDATRIDASALNTASAAIGSNGSGLTEAGGTGDHLTAIPWNASWDAEVQSEVQDALEVNNLDHLVKAAVDTDFATTVHLDSVVGQLADNGTTATFSRTTDSLEAIRDRGDGAWVTATGFSTLSQADVRSAVGLASANLDTQLTAIDDYLDTEVAAIKAKTDNLPADPADASDIAASFATVNSKLDAIDDYVDTEVSAIKAKTDLLPASPASSSEVAALLTTQLSESYNADGAAPTVSQALFAIMQRLTEFSISGTTITVKRLDGSTTAFTLTMNDASTPTSSTRSS